MPHNTLDVTSYNFTQNDELLLDTNVWLFVYGPQKPRNPKVERNRIASATENVATVTMLLIEFGKT